MKSKAGCHSEGPDSVLVVERGIIGAVEGLLQVLPVLETCEEGEAVEGALKIARRYHYNKGKAGCEIIAMQGSFHGRSMGAVSVTGKDHYRAPFEPLIGGVRFATFNDLDSVKAQINENTGAIIMEIPMIDRLPQEFYDTVKDSN